MMDDAGCQHHFRFYFGLFRARPAGMETQDPIVQTECPRAPTRAFSFGGLWRGIKRRCPQCGDGAVMSGYIKPLAECPSCGEDFRHISADDGPAWLTLLLVGHAVVPLMLVFGRYEVVPLWLAITVLSFVTLLGVYFVLPRAKGAFIALIWMTGATGQPLTANIAENDPNK